MSLKQFTTNFQELGKDPYLRNDEKYHIFLNFSNWDLFNVKNKNLISLKNILVDDYNNFEYEEGEEYKGIPTGQTYLDEDGYIKEFQPVTAEDHPGRLKYKASNDNILISSLRLAKSPALCFENENLTDYVFSNGFYIYKVKEGWNKKFILYILRTKRLKSILDNNIYRGIGISAYKDDDLKKIKIPVVPKSKQDQIVAEIEPIEKKIKELKNQISPSQKIINKVFAREFRFDLEKFEELKKEKFFEVDFRNFNDYKLRTSFKSNNYYIKFLLKFLNNKSTLLKNFLMSSIISGATPKYSEDGECRIVKTINVNKDGFVEKFDDDKFVSKAEKILEYKNILVTTHGEGRGKFGIYIFDDLATTDANCSIVKFNINKINPLYLNYYFNSFFGKELFYYLESETKSVRYMKNNDLETMPILFNKKSQQKIVDEIKTELDKQEEMKKKIETQRNKIDEIIRKAIL